MSTTPTVEQALRTKIVGFQTKLAEGLLSAANRLLIQKLLDRATEELAKLDSASPDPAPIPTTPLVVQTPEDQLDGEHGTVHEVDKAMVELAEKVIPYNAKQKLAIDTAASRRSFVLTGPAGSGKTTTVKGIVNRLIADNILPALRGQGHKYLPASGGPGIVFTAFTNKAVENIKKHLPLDLQRHCITIHKLLEFEPVEEPETDPVTGKIKRNFRFEPKRDYHNPLPDTIHTLVVDEASMVGVDLWNLLIAAIRHGIQIIFVGDIQQLPPVFGKSIFIHAMQRKLMTVELTEVHRQALNSPILALAHRVLSGKMIPAPQLDEWNIKTEKDGELIIRPWKKSYGKEAATVLMQKTLCKEIDVGNFDPEKDVVLTLFNDDFGVKPFNQAIAWHYAQKLGAEVHEVFAATNKIYLRIDERVLVDKVEHRVVEIKKNPAYIGKYPRNPSTTMNYMGHETDAKKIANGGYGDLEEDDNAIDVIDGLLDSMDSTTDGDSPARRAASHIIKVKSVETGVVRELRASGEVGNIALGYVMTVHKSQGSEWETVYFITHKCQQNMMFRELVYTAITRAKRRLVMMIEPNSLVVGINTQRLPGITIDEKIDAFDRYVKLESRAGSGNSDQVPKGLERLLKEAA